MDCIRPGIFRVSSILVLWMVPLGCDVLSWPGEFMWQDLGLLGLKFWNRLPLNVEMTAPCAQLDKGVFRAEACWSGPISPNHLTSPTRGQLDSLASCSIL